MGKHFKKALFNGFLLFGMFSLPFLGQAQALMPFTLHWRKATVVLANADTLYGNASLTMPEDLLRLSQSDGASAIYPPSEVRALVVEEPYNAIPYRKSGDLLLQKRTYGQYLWNRDKDYSNYKAPALFVVVFPGKYALLLREEKPQIQSGGTTLATQALNAGFAKAQESGSASVAERFYISIDGQEAKWLRNPKQDLLELFPGKEKAIKNFAQKQGINFIRLDHLARIVAFCNTL